jgi:hypothetical protein
MTDQIGVESGSTVLITKLLSANYPDVERIIPKESTSHLTLHREELMTLLKQVALFTTDKSHSVQFTLTPGELTLTANASDIGDGKVSMPVDYAGDLFEIAFNPLFFHDILRHCKDETVNFSITTSHSPGLITDSTTAHFVIMPMCLYRSGYDFKKLFTISAYYDRSRQDFYQALQSVRNNDMDMTSWLEYFCKALETQMHEIQFKGSQAMKLDVLVLEHKLSERQKQALESLKVV